MVVRLVVAAGCCSGPDTVTAHGHGAPRPATRGPFNGAPDTVLESMAENPLGMYFPPLAMAMAMATHEQLPETLASDTATPSSAPKHRLPEEFAGRSSCAPERAGLLQLCSDDMMAASAGAACLGDRSGCRASSKGYFLSEASAWHEPA